MEPRIFRFSECLGLNTNVDPRRAFYDPASGRYEAVEAVNVVLDDTGQIAFRPGFSLALSGAWHSLFADRNEVYGVSGDTMYRILLDNSLATTATGLTAGLKMAYVRVHQWVFWSNGVEKGVITDGAGNSTWGGETWPFTDDDREFVDPPAGHLLEYYAGRVWIAKDNLVFHTEPGMFHFVDAASGFLSPFDSKIRMLRAVDDGLYISTGTAVFFVQGGDPNTMNYRVVSGSPAVAGTDAQVDPLRVSHIGQMGVNTKGVIWTGGAGVVFGGQGGQTTPLTRDKISFPAGSRGTAAIFNNQYFVLMEE